VNRWNIPEWLQKEVKARNNFCLYCGIEMVDQMPPGGSRKSVATQEHIILIKGKQGTLKLNQSLKRLSSNDLNPYLDIRSNLWNP